MSDFEASRNLATRLVCVLAHSDDELTEFQEKVKLHGIECKFSYDEDFKGRQPTQFDQMIEGCEGVIVIISKNSLQDPWLQHCRKSLEKYIPLLIDISIGISDLPLDIRVHTCLTVKDSSWHEKLGLFLQSSSTCASACASVPLGRIAPGLACQYVNGFLRDQVLPLFEESLRKWVDNNDVRGGKVVQKFINLIPKSCNCDIDLTKYFDRQLNMVEIRSDYLGTPRNFDQPIYRVEGDQGDSYYAVIVLNSTIHSLYEMSNHPSAGLDHESVMKERALFEIQMKDMLEGKPIEILTFDDTEEDLRKTMLETCRKIVEELP